MYPPRFNLRHFTSHLAPGGYCLFHVFMLVVFLMWFFFPSLLSKFASLLNDAQPAQITIAFLIFTVISYFVGVVLTLPSVDLVDQVSVERTLRGILNTQFKGSPFQRANQLSFFARLSSWFRLFGPSRLPVPDAARLDRDSGVKTFRDWIRYLASCNLKVHILHSSSASGAAQRINARSLCRSRNTEELMTWLWAADAFPYPLWLVYKTALTTTPERCAEFNRHVWCIIIETMRGDISARSTTRAPFNRCKLFVQSRSEHLGAELYDREARTRMMAGCYYGLWFASRSAAALLVPIIPGWTYYVATEWGWAVWRLPHASHYFGLAMLYLVMSLVFNVVMQWQVVKNFHILRMNESEAVFDSYMIAKNLGTQTVPNKALDSDVAS